MYICVYFDLGSIGSSNVGWKPYLGDHALGVCQVFGVAYENLQVPLFRAKGDVRNGAAKGRQERVLVFEMSGRCLDIAGLANTTQKKSSVNDGERKTGYKYNWCTAKNEETFSHPVVSGEDNLDLHDFTLPVRVENGVVRVALPVEVRPFGFGLKNSIITQTRKGAVIARIKVIKRI